MTVPHSRTDMSVADNQSQSKQPQNHKTRKEDLIESLLKTPENFTDKEFEELVHHETGLNYEDVRRMVMRIYRINEATLHEYADASQGNMGMLNAYKNWRRQKRFDRSVKQGFRLRQVDELQRFGKTDRRVILAEGDSWFLFPVIVKDLIDHLGILGDGKYAITSIAAAGDWVMNIIYEGKYIEEISLYKPDVFLISGGGNDLLSESRVAYFVTQHEERSLQRAYNEADDAKRAACALTNPFLRYKDSPYAEQVGAGLKYLHTDVLAFLLTLKAMYHIMFQGLHRVRSLIGRDMQIIMQGYDHVFPRPFSWKEKYFYINLATGSGKWLHKPLRLSGIGDRTEMRHIIWAMLYGFNESFRQFATGDRFPNFYYVDNRGVAPEIRDWVDEIHLRTPNTLRVARGFDRAIRQFDGTTVEERKRQQRIIETARLFPKP